MGILGSDSSEDGGACEGACDNSDSVGSSNYSAVDGDYFYGENIMVYLDLSFQNLHLQILSLSDLRKLNLNPFYLTLQSIED